MRVAVLSLCVLLASCKVEWGANVGGGPVSQDASGPVLIYTSMYRPVVEALEAALKEDLPAIQPQWYQAGSEKVASRLDAELSAGSCPADLLITSDPAHYARLKHDGALRVHVPPGALKVPRQLVDPDGTWVTMRLSTMVLAWPPADAAPPKRLPELWSMERAGTSIVGDPLSSGTYFTALALMEWEQASSIFPFMRAAQVVASGGNSSVLEKLLSGEKRAGMLLLENVLASNAAGHPLGWRIPEDGAPVIPGPVAMLKTGPHPVAAAAVEDWLLGERAQRIIVSVGLMHAAREGVEPPAGTPSLQDLLSHSKPADASTWDHLAKDGATLKAHFGAAYGR